MSIEDILKDLKEIEKLKKCIDDNQFEKFKEAVLNDCAEINLKKDKTNFQIGVKGRGISLLLLLAEAEKQILHDTNTSQEEFEFFKNLNQ